MNLTFFLEKAMNLSTMKQSLGRLVIVRFVKGQPTQTEQLPNTNEMEACVFKGTAKPTSAYWQGFACLCVFGGKRETSTQGSNGWQVDKNQGSYRHL